jgi:integrase
MAHSTSSKKTTKPEKPYSDFPLFPHATKRWAKKIRGKFQYFGPWDDWRGALDKFQEQRDDLMAGRTPRGNREGLTVRDLCNRFMTAKEIQRDAGDIVPKTYHKYMATCTTLVNAFGKHRLVIDLAAGDFEQLRASLAKTCNPNTLGLEVQCTRVVFNYAYNAGLIEHPIRFGPTFKRPAKRILRALRQKQGPRMFEADQLHQIMDVAGYPFKAMVLLGVNCGFGNQDCGTLPMSALDLDSGWVNFPRPKTAVERRCPLWPETIEAIRDSLAVRKKPLAAINEQLVFLTKRGEPWVKEDTTSPIGQRMRYLLGKLDMHRPGLSFYALRHTFETIAGESRDQVAVNHIMGHADASMAGVYRERISDERLQDVTDFVRSWLFPPKEKSAK